MTEQPRLGTDVTYGEYPSGVVLARFVDDDGEQREASIPADEGNRDYADYLAWVEAGHTPEELADPTTEPAQPKGEPR